MIRIFSSSLQCAPCLWLIFLGYPNELGAQQKEAGPELAKGFERIDIRDLKFDTPELRQRFMTFDAVATAFAGKEFKYRPYQKGFGNGVSAVWAKNVDFDRPCEWSGPRESLKDIHRIGVGTYVGPVLQAKSATLGVEYISANPEQWCVSWRHEGAHGWSIWFYRWSPAKFGIRFRPVDNSKERFVLPVLGYAVSHTVVSTRDEVGSLTHEHFRRHVQSAESLHDASLTDLDILEKRVVSVIEGHKAQKMVYEKNQGDGKPPKGKPQPLTADEEKIELIRAKQHFAGQAKLVREHHREMYTVLRKSFPIERCWPEVAEKKLGVRSATPTFRAGHDQRSSSPTRTPSSFLTVTPLT